MSQSPAPSLEPILRQLADQVMELAAEIAMLRESIVTAAEWDNQARQERQRLLDTALTAVQKSMHILVGVNLLLVGLVVWLLVRAGT